MENSTIGAYLLLAGQYPEYLYKQLTQFKGGPGVPPLRHNEIMPALVKDLSPDDMKALAAFYAAQSPAPGATSNAALVNAGKLVYTHGGTNGAPACISCHRATGGGIEPDFPRITGQHEEYVETRLHAWKSGTHGGKEKLMSLIVPLLSDDEIASVSAYVAALKRNPGWPVAPALHSARSSDGTGRDIGQAFNLLCPASPINPLSNGKRSTSIDPQDPMSLRALSL